MYLNHFGLEKHPFYVTPDPEFLYESPSHREALASIIYGVEERKGFVAIIGDVGVGKTTIGKLLAERLGYDFVDMDEEIEKREGITISEIFRVKGESRFRELESRLVKELSQNNGLVIACGGGVIADTENAEILLKSSRMVYLTASIEEIINRIDNDNSRPLLEVENPEKVASELYERRKPVYTKYAEITVDTTSKTPKEIVEMVLEALK